MRGKRSFRYGARLMITAPLAAVFTAVTAEMVMLALAARSYWRVGFIAVGSVSTLLALAMVREVAARLRGKRQIVVAARELIMPEGTAIPFREIRALELGGEGGFRRTLAITHAAGKVEISGVMLGSVGELDEIHGLLKAARKPRS